jgi:hypothetical protein
MIVHVVMGNDYPEAVFTTARAAKKFCKKKAEEPASKNMSGAIRIYWRVYAFELQK